MNDEIKTHPVQTPNARLASRIGTHVTLKAYEVYSHVYAPQKAMITDGCRGGFSTGELIAFLYAHTFPKEEWSKRASEALRGMENL